jgi:hypothetical protein
VSCATVFVAICAWNALRQFLCDESGCLEVDGLSLFKLLHDRYSLFSFYFLRAASIQMGRDINLEQAIWRCIVRKLFFVGIVLMTLLPAAAFARGVVVVGPVGPYGWYGPYYGPYGYGPYPVANAGEVKFDTDIKDAEVLINGSYAGTVRKLKTMTMRPGSYDISVRAPGRETFEQKVYVVAGKTLKLHPDLRVQSTSVPTTR